MSNIERKYSYLDEGVFPEVGEYGVTYLTLYSSGAGNVYDGWMWDPDRVHYSETERTFGYRNPDYPDYCWDDEVVVDLSNAQSRQESSEFAQGRITSFNTNVSSRPIVLQDIDITGLDEEEREALATTVLFSAIPLVKDAYIQAMVEVQMKVNLSPTNTNGMVRVEAFYILNDESDRTMRPNPVHTFAVSTANERHTLPWLYWNPALKHEDNNYIGVKLLCTGGTAEIGISDDPEYGDAMITLTSAGLTGDHIDSGYPVSLDIYGKSMVPPGYKLKESDYTVLCTYDTGEVYEVTRLCEFTPPMGTKIVDPVTTLTANYQGLTASMSIALAQLEEIQLIPVSMQYEDEYTFDISDYTVLAYFDSGDIMDVTEDENTVYNPVMGTTITQTTTLTATYTPEWAPGSSFEDEVEIEVIASHTAIDTGTNALGGLLYTLYDDGIVEITGNANVMGEVPADGDYHEVIAIPSNIRQDIISKGFETYTLKWNAEGEIGGAYLPGGTGFLLSRMIDFSNVQIKPYIAKYPQGTSSASNPVQIYFSGQSELTSSDLSFLNNITYVDVDNVPVSVTTGDYSPYLEYGTLNGAFQHCESITDLDFLSNVDFSRVTGTASMFAYCTSLNDIEGLKNANMGRVTTMNSMFVRCESLESARDTSLWDPAVVTNTASMFAHTALENLAGVGQVRFGRSISGNVTNNSMFAYSNLNDLYGIDPDWFKNSKLQPVRIFEDITSLTSLNGSAGLDLSTNRSVQQMFSGCTKLRDISAAASWNVTGVRTYSYMFGNNAVRNLDYLSGWDLSSGNTFNGMLPFTPSDSDHWAEVSECTINSWMFSGFMSSKADTAVLTFTKLGNINYLQIHQVAIIDGYDYYTTGGMFSGRDLLRIDSNNNAIFYNNSAIPDWYKTRIETYINAGHYLTA